MLCLDVEVLRAFDVDQHRLAVAVEQDMVRAGLAVDQRGSGARRAVVPARTAPSANPPLSRSSAMSACWHTLLANPMGSGWYDNPMEGVVDQAGRIVLPKPIRDALGLLPGTKVDISPYGAGVQVVPAGRTARLVEEDGVLVSAGDTPVDDDILFGLIDAGRK
jgi:AbrB family looped-hinge helix DNA binding protein